MSKKKIKILHVLEAVGGGTKKALLLQLKNLNHLEFEITVCLPPPSIVAKTRVNELNDPMFGQYLADLGFRVVHIPMYGGARLVFLRNFIALFELWRFCRKEKFDVIHGHSAVAGFLSRIAGRLSGKCVTVYSPEGFAFSEHTPFLRKSIIVLLERFAGRFTDMIVACSQTEKAQALDAKLVRENKVTMIENPVELNEYEISKETTAIAKNLLLNKNGSKLIGTVARLAPQKNPLDFVRVANIVCQLRSDVEFILVGDGRMRDEVQALIKDFGLEDKVHLLGNRSDYLQIMSCFDVFILTSLWEGLPYAPVEALILGVPVVINNVTGAIDIVGEKGATMLVQPLKPEEMASKVVEILDNPNQSKEITNIISSGLRIRFDGRNTAEKMSTMYRQLLNI